MEHTSPSPKPSAWFLLLATVLTVFAAWGAVYVPFHPDESTALFMSADFETYWTHPSSLAWNGDQPVDLQTHYRLLDAPLSRQFIGLARFLCGLPALPQDWRWDQSWSWNAASGALPSTTLLLVARLANTLLLPFSLFWLYLAGRILGGEPVGLAAALLLGLNALVLLHTRRAMSEAALLFGVCFALWTLLDGCRPWLVGLSLALAFNAKQSAIALLPVGLLAAVWRATARAKDHPFRGALLNGMQVLFVFALVTATLNPVFWRRPLTALEEALARRQELAADQTADVIRLAPEKSLNTFSDRAAALLINLYMAPPAFAEYGNYAAQTALAEQAYQSIPGHMLLRGLLGGTLMLGLTLFGLALSVLEYRRAEAFQRRALVLAWTATAVLAVGLVVFFPLSWQRYVMPLVPLACLWSAYPLTLLRRSA